MASLELPPQEYLRQCLDYDPETGIVVWKHRPLEHFKDASYQKRFNSRFAGKRAGSQRKPRAGGTTNHWEVSLTFGGTCENYLLHRVIWKMVHGTEPDEIDHKNIDGGDNRLDNLRACDHHQNMSNTRIRSDNTSGFKGVTLVAKTGKWRAEINHRGRKMHIGYFDTRERAAVAYALKSDQLHGQFAGEMGV